MIPALLIIIVFIVLAALMITKRLPTLLAMPVMALAIGLVSAISAGLPIISSNGSGNSIVQFLFSQVLTEGSIKLSKAMMYAIFGAILSQVILKTGIAERIVKTAAELAGDRKFLVALFLTGASALVFTSLTGLGGVIMIGTLVLPVMMAAGISARLASSLLLFSIAIGGVFNAANWGFYESALKVDLATIRSFATSYGIMLALVTLVFLLIEMKRDRVRFAWSVNVPSEPSRMPHVAYLTPIIPVVLLLNPWYRWEIIPAFMAAALYGVLTTEPRKAVATLTASVIEVLIGIGPVLVLIIVIGVVLNAVMYPVTSD